MKLDFMLNGDVVDALTFIVHAEKGVRQSAEDSGALKDNIPRQLFECRYRRQSARA